MDSVAKILDENIEWESAMSFAEQIVTDAFLNNVNGIIKKTNGGITVCFIKTLKNNQPEQKKIVFSTSKATAEKNISSISKATAEQNSNDGTINPTLQPKIILRKIDDADPKSKNNVNSSALKRKKIK